MKDISGCYFDRVSNIRKDQSDNDIFELEKGGSFMSPGYEVLKDSKFMIFTYLSKVDPFMATQLGIKHRLNEHNIVVDPFIIIPLRQLPQDIDYVLHNDYSHIFLSED